MSAVAFHDEPRAGGPRGLRRVLLPLRRVLVRLLRPIFHRLADLLETLEAGQKRLAERQESLDRRVNALLNHGWDQAALLRRVALLEQQLDEIVQTAGGQRVAEPRPCNVA
jgi:hypothetical protein